MHTTMFEKPQYRSFIPTQRLQFLADLLLRVHFLDLGPLQLLPTGPSHLQVVDRAQFLQEGSRFFVLRGRAGGCHRYVGLGRRFFRGGF